MKNVTGSPLSLGPCWSNCTLRRITFKLLVNTRVQIIMRILGHTSRPLLLGRSTFLRAIHRLI